MQRLRFESPVPPIALFAVVAVAAVAPFAQVLAGLYDVWNLKPEYSHGIIIPVLSAWMIWRQRAQLRQLPFTGSWWGLALIVIGLALRFVGHMTTMHTFEHYAFLFVIYGAVLSLTGMTLFRRLAMPLGILIFAIPLPTFFNNALSLNLQLLSSQVGVAIIRAAGISVLLEGNVIDLGTHQLEVAEACSGLRYLFPLMTLAFIVAYLMRGPLWKRILVVVASVPISVLMNSLRIGFVGITVEKWGMQMLEGTLHDFEGWLIFMLSTAALLLTASALARIGHPGLKLRDVFTLPPVQDDAAAPRTGTGARSWQSLPPSFMAAGGLVLLGALSGFATPQPQAVHLLRDPFSAVPLRFGNWVGRADKLGSVYLDALRLDDYALTDYASDDHLPVNFYAAYYESQDTTRAVHSPNDCIPGGGWQIVELGRREFPASGATPAFKMNRAVIQMGSQRQIVYFWFQERGRRLTNEYLVRWYLFWDELTRHRTDGALVRFAATVPAGKDAADADASMIALGRQIVPTLSRYIPD
jgi:exosortase D (VPLPA-CTERM-specific)